MSKTFTQQEVWSPEQIRRRVAELGQWFHNINLKGVDTAPDHFLHDYPANKWGKFAHAVPADLTGKTVLDIGCNAGFYSIEMKRRGAERVVAIDSDDRYLDQARFATEVLGTSIEFRKMSVYEVGTLREKFDLVLFMGVFYHLRHPLLALDLIRENVVRDMMVFQSMQRGSAEIVMPDFDYGFDEVEHFSEEGYPLMYFVENRYAHDPTNWWIPNRACIEAILRSSGFEVAAHPEDEVYVCRVADLPDDMPRAVYPPMEVARQ